MATGPAGSGGGMAVICVGVSYVNEVAGVPPKSTAVTPVKYVPVIVTAVPPAVGPLDGLMPVRVVAAVVRNGVRGGAAEVDRGHAGEVRAGDCHGRPAGGGPARRAYAGQGRGGGG